MPKKFFRQDFYARFRVHGILLPMLKNDFLCTYFRAAGTYSGGNKRKLSTAIALIGKPSMVFLVRKYY